MCGIAGIISSHSTQASANKLKQMTGALAHRGPDGESCWLNADASVAFGHCRLSIIDLSNAAAQPMHYQQRYSIVHNGEIYNYIELRDELKQKGYSFSTRSDTEIILAAYDCWKQDCLQRFDGMFAFAIWDAQENTLFCARDRFGEKPFYYYHDQANDQWLFASEIKALWAAGAPRQINNHAMLNYLALGHVQHATDLSLTFYNDIYSLKPAHYLLLTLPLKNIVSKQYWQLSYNEQSLTYTTDQYKEKFSALFFESVKRRLRSDVAIGTSLSGGIDSSAIVAAIKQQAPSPVVLKCFSAVFPGFEKDEARYISIVTNHFGTESYTVTPTAQDFALDFEQLLRQHEEPFQSSSIYAQYKVYALAKQQGIKVILDGQGADETLAGYPKYIHWYLQELLAGKQHRALKNETAALQKNKVPFEWNYKNYLATLLPSKAAQQLEKKELYKLTHQRDLNRDFFHHYFNKDSVHKPVVRTLNDILYFNTCGGGLQELLRYADRNAMAHGREVRLPFLSHHLVEFIFNAPSSLKIQHGFTKYLLRLCMNGILPDAITWRTDKTGYEPPQASWMQNADVQELAMECKRKLVSGGILNPSVLDKKNQPMEAHAADNFDWRYLVAGGLL
jgi:asparagine synthase (glutamine-hydrolysing)